MHWVVNVVGKGGALGREKGHTGKRKLTKCQLT